MAEFDSEKDGITKAEEEQWGRKIKDAIEYLSPRGTRQIYEHWPINSDGPTDTQCYMGDISHEECKGVITDKPGFPIHTEWNGGAREDVTKVVEEIRKNPFGETWAQGGIIRDCQERSYAHGGTVADSISDAEEQKARDAKIVRRLRDNDWREHMYSDEEVLKAHEGTLTLASIRLGMSWRRFAGELKRVVIVIVDRVRLRIGW